MQKVIFDVIPTANPDEAIGHSRYVVNASTGIGMDLLQNIIENHIPSIDAAGVFTKKKVIRTDRYECPCCPTDLVALVQVSCEGVHSDEWDKVEGLYRVSIQPDLTGRRDCNIVVEKLSGNTIHRGQCSYLPQKDYKADRVAESRDSLIGKLLRRRK